MARRRDEHDDTQLPDDATDDQRREAGDRLRERIYATFTALAVLMALNSHSESLEPLNVLYTLLISVGGVLLAGLTSDLVAHMIVHNKLPTVAEFRHMLAVASRALGVLAVPAIMLLLAFFDVVTARTAVTVSLVSLIVSLAVIAQIAVKRTNLSTVKRLIVLVVIVALGVAVVALESLAHH
ncbi:hypothetical protein [Leifsonia poae]|uniref:Uncharacterized protein n=1 Tax=Leifsonia poae TaxID=110933 RepID=A0A9W6LZ47_9MICO|nr:hypothetical protein [Leifsonia poae]GLJ75224.1 hypothetical protein GCM10017584_07980 [Leifsonia poae]